MKKIITIASMLVLFVYLTNCEGDEEVATPNARIVSLLDKGGGIRFEWDPVDGADGYRVRVDGVLKYEGQNTYFEWREPAKKISIFAYAGDKESIAKTFDFTPVLTQNLEVWDATDPDPNHPSYVKFVEGTAIAVSVVNKEEAWMLFNEDLLRTNNHNNPNIDAAFSPISGDFDAENFIAPKEGNYETGVAANQGAMYYMWFEFSPIDNVIGPNDHFGKIKIVNKDGLKYTVKIYFQKYPGLRWLKTGE